MAASQSGGVVMKHSAHGVMSKAKAREMLEHGEVKGKRLTKKQRGLMGMVASGKKPRKAK